MFGTSALAGPCRGVAGRRAETPVPQRSCRSGCRRGVPSLPPLSVRALLLHYQQVACTDAAFLIRARGTWLAADDGALPRQLGLANRTAHGVLSARSRATARRWRHEWRAHGLLRPSGREAFASGVLLPMRPVGVGAIPVAALPLAAMTDPRTLAVQSTGPGWSDLPSGTAWSHGLLYGCSDPFDAWVLHAAGCPALALVDAPASSATWRGLVARLRSLRPRRLVLVCAATAAGDQVADRWRALAARAGILVETRTVPAGCAVRDIAHLAAPARTAAVRALLELRTGAFVPLPSARPARSAMHLPQRTPRPWDAEGTGLGTDLTAYLDLLASRGRRREECHRTARFLAQLWRALRAQGVRATTSVRRSHLERVALSIGGNAALSSVGSVGSQSRAIAAVRGFLRWAASTGRTPHDLSTALPARRRPVAVPPRVLGAADIERTLATIPHARPVGLRDRAMLEVLFATGMRRGELVGLDVADLDAGAGILRIRRGKGGTARLVPVTRRAVAWVQHYLERARPLHLAELREPALFVSRRGRRLTPKQVTARMHACWAAAGLPQAGSCHIVRHSVATLMHDRGADIRDLQALLGHALLTSTQLYTRVSMQRLHEVHRRTHPGAGEDSAVLPPV